MTSITLHHYLILSSILFTLGVFGIAINRKSLLTLLMCLELALLAVNIALLAFAAAHDDLKGQIMTLFVLTIAAAEAAIGLAIITAFFRLKKTIHVDDIQSPKIKQEDKNFWQL